jgi:tetratricopeptide (TPR) repeat protein
MALRPFPTNRNYEESIRGLRLLHELELAGTDQSEDADALRARLERPWLSLPEVQKKRLEGLSEDLYSIGGEIAERLPPNPQSQRSLVSALESAHAGDWDKALEMLRGCRQYLDPDVLSYLRGTIWFGAGDSATAALFFGHAAKLAPSDGTFVRLHLHSLWKSDRAAAAARAAEILAEGSNLSPAVIAAVADIRLMATRNMSDEEARSARMQLVDLLEPAIARAQREDREELLVYQSLAGSLGFCFDHLGDDASALRWFDLGVEADPTSHTLLTARGILRYGKDSTAAVRDFEQAIAAGSNVVWPYYFIAHYSLMSGRFDDCQRMCDRALSFPGSDAVSANLHEWLAISRAELGFSAGNVRAEFEAAVRLQPENDRIRRNFRSFNDSQGDHPPFPRDWETPKELEVQAIGRAGADPPWPSELLAA